jgi:hypothetical protein
MRQVIGLLPLVLDIVVREYEDELEAKRITLSRALAEGSTTDEPLASLDKVVNSLLEEGFLSDGISRAYHKDCRLGVWKYFATGPFYALQTLPVIFQENNRLCTIQIQIEKASKSIPVKWI